MNDSVIGVSLKSILWVDSDATAREPMRALFADYRVVFATSGYDAICERNRENFDAHVLDIWLPDWSGIQLCRDIRKIDPHVPIVFYTAAPRDHYVTRAIRAGASVYLQKQVDPGQLRQRLGVLLELGDRENLAAKQEEQLAIQDELQRRASAAIDASSLASESAARAIERTARVKALRIFLENGGTLANFTSWWPEVFAGQWAGSEIGQRARIGSN